jgi:phytol kinase
MLKSSFVALMVTATAALIWLRFIDFLAHRGVIPSDVSRKLIHIGTGPIFVVCWLLFPDEPNARLFAAAVPLLITAQFILVGSGLIKDQAAVDSMSRSGDRREILRGPMFYGIVFVLLTLIFWKESPVGIAALMMLCGGDGLADLAGSRMKSSVLPWAARKSIAGSVMMFLGGFLLTCLILLIYIWAGVIRGAISDFSWKIALLAFVGMIVESLPFKDIDNITVPLAIVILGSFLFPIW